MGALLHTLNCSWKIKFCVQLQQSKTRFCEQENILIILVVNHPAIIEKTCCPYLAVFHLGSNNRAIIMGWM